MLLTGPCPRFKVAWTRVVAKGISRIHAEESEQNKGMQSHKHGVVLVVVKCARYVVVAEINLFIGIGDSHIPKPNQMDQEPCSKDKLGLVALVCPVVNSITPRLWAASTIKNRTWVFVGVVQVDNALGRQMHIRNKVHQVMVHDEDIAALETLDQRLPDIGLRDIGDGSMIAISAKGLEVGLTGVSIDIVGDTRLQKTLDVG